MKQLVVFDLDGTLALSKSPLDDQMAQLLKGLLGIARVAIISGGDFPQFQKQVIDRLPPGTDLTKLSILPTTGTKFFVYDGAWRKLYADDLTPQEKAKIERELDAAVTQTGLQPGQTWGERIEDRETQITYSALGQEAPLAAKSAWDPDFSKRKQIQAILAKTLPEFSVRLGGTTSIDVTRPGIDKGYGIRKLRETLHIEIPDMMFVGDAIFPGGNDYAAYEAGVDCIRVRDADETKRVVAAILTWMQQQIPNYALR